MDKMNIGIYSLMESATSKAKEILQISAPNSGVECNNDRAGTDKLKALARNSDVVVITWLATPMLRLTLLIYIVEIGQ